MKKWICLQLTHTHLTMIQLAMRRGRWERVAQFTRHLSEPKQNPLTHPQLVETIARLGKKLKARKIYVSVSSDAVLVKWLSLSQPLPDADASLQSRAIETTLEAENHLPVPLDAAVFDYQISSPQSLLLGWTRLDGLAQVYQSLRALGIEWVYLTPQPVLLAQKLIDQCDRTERVCGVSVQENRCDLALVEKGEILGARSFYVQDQMARWETVKKTINNCPNPNQTPLQRLVLFQEDNNAPQPDDGLFDCEVTTAPWDWASGLIGSIISDEGVELNLLRPLLLKEIKHRKRLMKRWLWRGLPIVVGLLLLVANLYLFNAIESKQIRIDQLRDRHAKIKQLQTKTESLKTEHTTIEKALAHLSFGERHYPKLSKRLLRIAESIPKPVQLTEIHTLPPPRKPTPDFDARQTVRLIGLAPAQTEIDAFIAALMSHVEFVTVRQVATEPTLIKGEQQLEFTLLLGSIEEGTQ